MGHLEWFLGALLLAAAPATSVAAAWHKEGGEAECVRFRSKEPPCARRFAHARSTDSSPLSSPARLPCLQGYSVDCRRAGQSAWLALAPATNLAQLAGPGGPRAWPAPALSLPSALQQSGQAVGSFVLRLASAIGGDIDASPVTAPAQIDEAASLRKVIAQIDFRLRELDEKESPGRMVGRPLLALVGVVGISAVLGMFFGLPSYVSGGKAFVEHLALAGAIGAALGAGFGIVGCVLWVVNERRAIHRERNALLEEREELQLRLNAHSGSSSFSQMGATLCVVRF